MKILHADSLNCPVLSLLLIKVSATEYYICNMGLKTLRNTHDLDNCQVIELSFTIPSKSFTEFYFFLL